jgi:TonB-dependent receptor
MSLGYLCRRQFGIGLFLSILGVQVLLAQGSGTIKGKVIDKTTGDDLPGANIVVVNTSLGAAADLDGNFVLHFVPAGKWTMKVSYIGYNAVTEEIEVAANATLEKNFSLTPTTLMGEEVIVTAQARGQAEAINQQLASNKIANIVSEARIQELPDFNAAQAISRLPGVSTQQSSGEANKVVIRGLAPQYNQVAVGGITLASTGSNQIGVTSVGGLTSGNVTNDRSVDLTMVTPYMIKSIEVYKTLTPDMEANAIGGYVNMDLREAPDGFRTDLLYQSGYTQKTNEYGNYRAVLSASNRFFKNKLGIYLLGNLEQYDRSADNMNSGYQIASTTLNETGYRAVRVTQVTLNRHLETRKRYGGNLILDYALPSGSIKAVNMFSRLNSNYRDYNTILDYTSINYPINFRYRSGDGNTDLAVNSLEFTNDFKFISVDIKVANTYSRNNLPTSPLYAFFQNNGISHQHSVTGDTNVVPENLTHFVNYGPDTLTLLGSTSLFASDYHENDQIYKGDFKIPMNFGSVLSGFFKFGGEYRYNFHRLDQSTPYISINRGTAGNTDINRQVVDSLLRFYPNLVFGTTNQLTASNFTSGDTKLTNSFLDDKFGGIYWACDPSVLNWMMNYISHNPYLLAYNSVGGWFNGPYQNLPNDYKYVERYYAAYLMSEFDIGSKFMAVGGARFEENKGLYEAFNLMDERNPASQPFFPVTVYPESHYWLPMVQAKYNLGDWGDLRYAYTQTLARPDYTQLSPHFNISADSPKNINSGNPKLVPAQAYNHDILLTLHSNTIGLFSIGGFYKEIKHFTYATSYHLHSKAVYDRFGIEGLDSLNSFAPFLTSADDDATLNTFINSRYLAYVRGIEADFQTRFWYLPAPLNGVVLGINYTHVWSKATYPYFDEKALRGVITVFTDSTRIGRLVDQPNDILNAYLGYDYKGFSARVSCVFQGNSVTFIGAYPEQDGFSKDYFRVDFSARQRLPWKGLELFLDVNNLNSESNIAAQQSLSGFTSENYYGLTANLGIRYQL